jgi:hypothetical protein
MRATAINSADRKLWYLVCWVCGVCTLVECRSQGCEKSETGFTSVGSDRGGPACGGRWTQKGNEHVSMWLCRTDVVANFN